ncbi:hypothetical protein N7533_007353 [Penicillium manginii]|jgi:cytochrome P450|uniref:uncharacterized protein n=1 Tax=Penicillium manginii TaxID=203109 RepID=UPI00254951E8|nr:uncharacterized protein N7533_007353 [Penicillium manginii]KAJ5750325.1 hypothetical protein N7533_007353 [Penicillium manginii]
MDASYGVRANVIKSEGYSSLSASRHTPDINPTFSASIPSDSYNVIGADTTATAMSGTVHSSFWPTKPTFFNRLTKEIRTTFANEEEIRTGDLLNSCKLLQACINGTMRLTPPVATTIPRTVLSGGLVVDQELIPEGTMVGTTTYAIQRNASYFQSPDEYCPDRWIVNPEMGVDEESIKIANQAFCPFSIGARSCVGWKLAWTELDVPFLGSCFDMICGWHLTLDAAAENVMIVPLD